LAERPRRFRWPLLAAAVVVTVVFSWVAVRSVRFGDVAEALRSNEWIWIVPATALLAVSVVMRGVRWWLLFAPGGRPPLTEVLRATVIGLCFNNLLPLRAGEAARLLALRRRTPASGGEILGTIATERLYDVGALLLMLFVLLPVLPEVTWARAAAWLALALAVGIVAIAVGIAHWGERGVRLIVCVWPLRWLPVESGRLEQSAVNLLRGLAGLRPGRLALEAFVLTAASWIVIGLSFWLLTPGFDLGLGPEAGVFVVIAVGLALVLPSGPAGLGVFEAGVVVALSAYDIDPSVALSYALVAHAVHFVPYVAAGLVLLPAYRSARR
jgi:hypothetical protein